MIENDIRLALDNPALISEPVQFDLREGNFWLTLNRPHVLNAFDEKLLDKFLEILNGIDDPERPLIITGAGRAFCAGGDLNGYLARLDDRDALERYFLTLTELFCRIVDYPGVTIAAVNGVAAAGGLELVCVCDVAIAAETARLGDAHINYGLHPGAGASRLLSSIIGERRARWLLLSGEFIDAQEAERIGLINRVVPYDKLEEAATETAHALARHSRSATRRTKHLMKPDIRDVLRAERESLLDHFSDPETRARLEEFAARSKAKSTQ